MNYYLFLDIDGVLHPDEARFTSPFCFIENFCDAVREADPSSKLEIVISSTWRLRHTLDDLIAMFPPDIAKRIVGMTPTLDGPHGRSGSRQREIESWLAASPRGNWLAIDDQDGLYAPDCKNLFIVPYSDPTLARDIRDAGKPLTSELREIFLERKRLNRSTGLTDRLAILFCQRLRQLLTMDSDCGT